MTCSRNIYTTFINDFVVSEVLEQFEHLSQRRRDEFTNAIRQAKEAPPGDA
jgi:hypothetical protein